MQGGESSHYTCRACFDLEVSDGENPARISFAVCRLYGISDMKSFLWKIYLIFSKFHLYNLRTEKEHNSDFHNTSHFLKINL